MKIGKISSLGAGFLSLPLLFGCVENESPDQSTENIPSSTQSMLEDYPNILADLNGFKRGEQSFDNLDAIKEMLKTNKRLELFISDPSVLDYDYRCFSNTNSHKVENISDYTPDIEIIGINITASGRIEKYYFDENAIDEENAQLILTKVKSIFNPQNTMEDNLKAINSYLKRPKIIKKLKKKKQLISSLPQNNEKEASSLGQKLNGGYKIVSYILFDDDITFINSKKGKPFKVTNSKGNYGPFGDYNSTKKVLSIAFIRDAGTGRRFKVLPNNETCKYGLDFFVISHGSDENGKELRTPFTIDPIIENDGSSFP